MFKFKPTRKTYSDPIAATFKPGIPLGRKYSAGDMCLLHDGFQGSKVFLNSRVLRAALLNSKGYIEEVLEIRITDMRDNEPKTEVKDMEVVEADLAKGDVPKSGDDLILDSEDLIVGNADIDTSDLTFPELPEEGKEEEDKGEITEEVIIEGVNEIPESAEVVDEVVIDAPAEVADAIVETLTEEVKEDEAPVEKKTKKTSKK